MPKPTEYKVAMAEKLMLARIADRLKFPNQPLKCNPFYESYYLRTECAIEYARFTRFADLGVTMTKPSSCARLRMVERQRIVDLSWATHVASYGLKPQI